MSAGETLKQRWAKDNHDGLTEVNLEGAVRLGWLTREEVNTMTGDDDEQN